MKISIMGYSGSGKSTLCRRLAEKYRLPALHLDQVQFLPGWKERSEEEQRRIVSAFLNDNPAGWVIDGNCSRLCYERRIGESDVIILLLFGRLRCLCRCFRRYLTYQVRSRPDMTEGCAEKLDAEFVRWILRDGRTKSMADRYRELQQAFPDKAVVLRNQRQINEYMKNRG